jgi:hypothetical protein
VYTWRWPFRPKHAVKWCLLKEQRTTLHTDGAETPMSDPAGHLYIAIPLNMHILNLKSFGTTAIFILRLWRPAPTVIRLCGQRICKPSSGDTNGIPTNSSQLNRSLQLRGSERYFFFLIGIVWWSPIGSTRHCAHQKAYCASPRWLWWWRNWWNDWQGKPKYSEKTCPQCRFVHHKRHMLPGREPGPPRWEASD